jgi:hypothetical protein
MGEIQDTANKDLIPCCGETPSENTCGLRGRSWFEVVCLKCKRRTGALGTPGDARYSWNIGDVPSFFAHWNYEVQDTKRGIPYEIVKKPLSLEP